MRSVLPAVVASLSIAFLSFPAERVAATGSTCVDPKDLRIVVDELLARPVLRLSAVLISESGEMPTEVMASEGWVDQLTKTSVFVHRVRVEQEDAQSLFSSSMTRDSTSLWTTPPDGKDADRSSSELPVEAMRVTRYEPAIGVRLLAGAEAVDPATATCRCTGEDVDIRVDLKAAARDTRSSGWPAVSEAIDQLAVGTLTGTLSLERDCRIRAIRYHLAIPSGSGEVAHAAEWQVLLLEDTRPME